MSNKEQTAVEWLEKEFVKLEATIGVYSKMYEIIEQAKEMEKQQIMDAYNAASGGDSWYNGKEFYNKEYGS